MRFSAELTDLRLPPQYRYSVLLIPPASLWSHHLRPRLPLPPRRRGPRTARPFPGAFLRLHLRFVERSFHRLRNLQKEVALYLLVVRVLPPENISSVVPRTLDRYSHREFENRCHRREGLVEGVEEFL